MRTLPLLSALTCAGFTLAGTPALAAAPPAGLKFTTADPATADDRAVADVVSALFSRTDAGDWAAVRALLADPVIVDYAALGGEAGEQTPEDVTTAWSAALPGFEAPDWLTFDPSTLTAKVMSVPTQDQVPFDVNMNLIIEFYR